MRCSRIAAKAAIISAAVVMTAQPLLATWSSRYLRHYPVVGVNEFGNPNFKYDGTSRGTAKVVKYQSPGLPTMIYLAGRGSVKNRSGRTQIFRNWGLPIPDPDYRRLVYEATSDLTIILALWRSRGYNLSSGYVVLDQQTFE